MSHRSVEQFLGRLATDPDLRRRLRHDPHATVAAFQDEGHELSAIEREALARTAPDAVETFAASLDGRIQRSAHEVRS